MTIKIDCNRLFLPFKSIPFRPGSPLDIFLEELRPPHRAGLVLSWSQLETEEGKYDFDWLERAVDAAGKTVFLFENLAGHTETIYLPHAMNNILDEGVRRA